MGCFATLLYDKYDVTANYLVLEYAYQCQNENGKIFA